MAHIAYYRVSSADESVEDQRHAMLSSLGLTASVVAAASFQDDGHDGSVPAAQRPGFGRLLDSVREGDTLHVYALDRLGRDALDVQATVRSLLDKGVSIEIHGLGRIARGVGELILAVLAQMAAMERSRTRELTAAGRDKAKESLAATGRTHRGKLSLGRPNQEEPALVAAWRKANKASIAATAKHWGLSTATVKRYCAMSVDAPSSSGRRLG